jgi:TorA maturation chaperone TorD
MELFRSLGSLIEPPSEETSRLALLLDLDPLPEAGEHTDLFLFQLYPFASVYLDGQGKMGGEARDRIAGFWRALELSPPSEPDHLTILLAFYSQILERQSEAGPGDRERWQHVRSAFLWEHLMSWLPVYVDKVRDLDRPFYWGWADILARVLVDETADLPAPSQLPLHLREAPPILDPREAEGDDFLDALLSPVRSGFILVRSDLARAGSQLQLGVRAGERRYVLKALLGQDDKATVQWLGGEAGRWAERHSAWAPATGPIADFWSSRATATANLLADLANDL